MSTRKEIDALVAEAGDLPLTAEMVVERAKDASRFPNLNEHLWKVPEATLAAEARLQRAHKLLINIRVVTEEGTVTRMLMHTRGTKGYVPAEKVATSPDLAAIKLRQLAADIGRARQRLSAFRSFIPDDIAEDIDAALARAEQRATPQIVQQVAS
jgi:hypothetical protein